MDDRTAIERCVNGDRDAYRHLVERYQGQALGHALAILGRREDAKDALQDALIRAYRALPRFDPRRSFYPWLYVILRNCCYRLARRRQQLSPLLDSTDIALDAPEGREEIARTVGVALGRLSAKDREIVSLRHFDGLTYEELAARLDIPRGTVMSRLFNARKRLRAQIEADRERDSLKEKS